MLRAALSAASGAQQQLQSCSGVSACLVQRSSLKFKGWVLDRWVKEFTGGRPYDHVVGFELGELGRMMADQAQLGMPGRNPVYPLIEWGWHREDAEAYIREHLKTEWIKSACTFCPYALTSEAGRVRTIPRYIADPDQAMLPLLMEHTAVALNPRQGLAGGKRLVDLLAAAPDSGPLLRQFAEYLDGQRWAVMTLCEDPQSCSLNFPSLGVSLPEIVPVGEGLPRRFGCLKSVGVEGAHNECSHRGKTWKRRHCAAGGGRSRRSPGIWAGIVRPSGLI
ncbi:hypothetical protein [Nonomuraea sp. NPDC052265]|uniref:hypothetical protein n=1 Tax=Nonomuraea sp. NPDC052265 TaxID=3364374 RepID=UPI0037CC4817